MADDSVLDLSRCGGPTIDRIGDLPGGFDFAGDCALPDAANPSTDCPSPADALPASPPVSVQGPGTVVNNNGETIIVIGASPVVGGPTLINIVNNIVSVTNVYCVDGTLVIVRKNTCICTDPDDGSTVLYQNPFDGDCPPSSWWCCECDNGGDGFATYARDPARGLDPATGLKCPTPNTGCGSV